MPFKTQNSKYFTGAAQIERAAPGGIDIEPTRKMRSQLAEGRMRKNGSKLEKRGRSSVREAPPGGEDGADQQDPQGQDTEGDALRP